MRFSPRQQLLGSDSMYLPGLSTHRRAAGHSCRPPRAECHSSRRQILRRTFQKICSRAASISAGRVTLSAFYSSRQHRCPARDQSLRSSPPCSDQPINKRMSRRARKTVKHFSTNMMFKTYQAVSGGKVLVHVVMTGEVLHASRNLGGQSLNTIRSELMKYKDTYLTSL